MDDSKIIELFFERSEQAIIELSQKYGALFMRIAENILGDTGEGEECVNDAYLGVWEKIPPARPAHLSAYVCRVVRNQALKRYHHNSAAKRNSHFDLALDELDGIFPSAVGVEEVMAAEDLSREIDVFLAGLSKTDRVIFVKRYYYSESVGEIARTAGITEHGVSVKLYRIRERLKGYLLKKGVKI